MKIGKAFFVPLGYFCDEEMPSQLLNLLPSDIKDLIQDKEMQELLKLGRRLSKRDTRLMMQIVGILAQGKPLPDLPQ